MKAISRSSRLVAALAATTGLLLTGCSTGAGQPNAAAIIGDKVIPVAEVQRRVEGGIAAQSEAYLRLQSQNRLDIAGRGMLSVLIRQELLERLAQREGVRVDEAAVDAVVSRYRDNLPETAFPAYDLPGLRERVRTDLLASEIGKKYANRTSVVADVVVTNERDDALTKARQMAKGPAASAQLVKEERAKQRQANAEMRLDFWQAEPSVATSPLFATPAGTVVAFPIADDSGQLEQQTTPTGRWVVAYVHRRDTNARGPVTPPGGNQTSVQTELYGSLGRAMASILREEVGLKVNPRYGTWDLTNAQLVPSALERATIQLKATPPRS